MHNMLVCEGLSEDAAAAAAASSDNAVVLQALQPTPALLCLGLASASTQ
jgi:hypothetical protein